MDWQRAGMRIRRERLAAGMTQQELAEKAGISTAFVGHIERGTRKPSVETLVKLGDALQVRLEKFLKSGD